MPTTGNAKIDIALYALAAVIVLFLGYQIGRMLGSFRASRLVAAKEQDLFTAQKGFKTLYETELNNLKAENTNLTEQVQTLTARVEEYRKKAAGFGGLFSSGGKKADAMYALLLENEALEEALHSQNEKLRQERTDALQEQMRNTSYRRVLMSQLLNDERIKSYVAEILSDEKRLPGPGANGAGGNARALPSQEQAQAAAQAD
jgi:cell division protein FtsB